MQYPLIGYCPMTTYVIMYKRYDYLSNRLTLYSTFFAKQHSPTVSALLLKLQLSHLLQTATDNKIFNSTALPSAISGSATIHVMDSEFIHWGLYDLFGACTLKFLETMQDYFWRFRRFFGKVLRGFHMASRRILGVHSSGVGIGCSMMK